jgi:MFS family permease
MTQSIGAATHARRPSPFTFFITTLPFGVGNAFIGVATPFLLRKASVPVETIAFISAIALVPGAWQFLWAPLVDLKIRHRSWLVLCSALGALCMGACLLLKLPEQLHLFEVLLTTGAALVSLVGSCNGALISTTLAQSQRGRAAGWLNAAFMGASALGGGVVLTAHHHFGAWVSSLALMAMIFLPSLAALRIEEPPPPDKPVGQHLRAMWREVWSAVMSKLGLGGVLLCLSPVGTAALTYLWSALGTDFHASERTVWLVNGYGGGLVTAVSCLVAGFLMSYANPRVAYLTGGVLTAICCVVMIFCPTSQTTFVIGATCYLIVAGICYAAFSVFVLEISSQAKEGASALYTVFTAASNQAIAYTLWLDGKAHAAGGTNGLLWCDAGLNLAGVVLLVVLLATVFRTATRQRPSPDAAQPLNS